MALVVTARSPVQEAPAGLGVQPALARARPGGVLAWLAVLSAGAGALSLIGDSAARSAPSLTWLSTTALAGDILAALLTLGACATAWLARRDDAALLLAVTLAVVVSATRALSAAVLLSLDAAILAEIASLGLGFLAQGCLVWAAAASLLSPAPGARAPTAQTELFRRVAEVTALVLFGVGLTGVTVRAVGASWACSGVFPDCNGLGALPLGREPLADVQLYHRLLAYVAAGLVLWLTVEAFRTQGARLGRASLVLAGATLLEGGIGAVSVSLSNPPLGQALHTAGAVAAWSAAVGLVALSRRLAPAGAAVASLRVRERSSPTCS
jgi:heme A synthase